MPQLSSCDLSVWNTHYLVTGRYISVQSFIHGPCEPHHVFRSCRSNREIWPFFVNFCCIFKTTCGIQRYFLKIYDKQVHFDDLISPLRSSADTAAALLAAKVTAGSRAFHGRAQGLRAKGSDLSHTTYTNTHVHMKGRYAALSLTKQCVCVCVCDWEHQMNRSLSVII